MAGIPNIDIDPPKYGPPNMAAQLFGMISSLPDAYQQGVKQKFERGQMERTEELQKPILGPDGKPSQDAMAIASELAKRYPERSLELPVQALTTKATQDYFNNRRRQKPDFPSGDGGSSYSPSNPNMTPDAHTGRVGQIDQSEESAGPAGEDTRHQNVRQLAINAGIDPNSDEFRQAFAGTNIDRDFTSSSQAAGAAKRIQMLSGAGDETGTTGAPPDPRRSAPPNVQPGVMGGPPTVAPSEAAQGFAPYQPGGAPPQAQPGPQMAQAAPGLAGGMQPFLQPSPQRASAPQGAPGAPSLVPQQQINDWRNKATDLLQEGQFVPAVAAVNKQRAENLMKAADEAQKARDEVAKKREEAADPAIQAENTRREIEKGNISAGQKEEKLLQTRAAIADQSNQKLAVLRTQMSDPNFYSGEGHEIVQKYRGWLAALGKDPNAAKPMEVFHKTTMDLLNERIQGAVQSGYTRIQIAEIRNMKEQIANLKVTPATNRYIMEEMSRIHQMDIKLNGFADQYAQSHGYLDRGWPAAKEAFLSRPENRLFTPQEIAHPEALSPSYYPRSMYGDVAKTKAFIRNQGLKDSDPVAVDDPKKPPGPDGLPQRKLIDASHLLRITVP